MRVSGWAFSPRGELTITVRESNGELADFALKRVARREAREYFATHGIESQWARESGFSVDVSCQSSCSLELKDPAGNIEKVPFDEKAAIVPVGEMKVSVDAVRPTGDLPDQTSWDSCRRGILSKVGWGYQRAVPVLTAAALLLWLWGVVRSVRRRRISPLHVLAGALLIGAGARLVLLTAVEVTSFQAINGLYMSPAYSLLLGFVVLAFGAHTRPQS